MLVFIDESGDPGFNLDGGSTPIFVVAMIIFADSSAAQHTANTIEQSQARRLHKPEFKFSKCRDDIRDMFFATVRQCPFRVRSIVVEKNVIYSRQLKSDKEKFYEFFVRQMMDSDGRALDNARVVIDGSGDREFRRKLNTALRSKIGQGKIQDVRFKDSESDVLVQLADMCAGAIARSRRQDRENPDRWRSMLEPRIDDVWLFR